MADSLAKRIGRGCLYAFGAALVFGAVFVWFMPEGEYVRQRMSLETEGQVAPAKITDKVIAREDSGRQDPHRRMGSSRGIAAAARIAGATNRAMDDQRHMVDVYYLDYSFAPKKDTPVAGSIQVTRDIYDKVAKGADVEALYLPSDPTISRLLRYSEPVVDNGPGAKIFMCSVMVMAGAWFGGYGWWLSRKIASPSPSAAAEIAVERTVARIARTGAVAPKMQAPKTTVARSPTPTVRKQGFGNRARA